MSNYHYGYRRVDIVNDVYKIGAKWGYGAERCRYYKVTMAQVAMWRFKCIEDGTYKGRSLCIIPEPTKINFQDMAEKIMSMIEKEYAK